MMDHHDGPSCRGSIKNLESSNWRSRPARLPAPPACLPHPPRARSIQSSVMKRWTQLRDTWRKSLDENKETKKSGSGTKSKPYKYNQEMSFLKPIIKPGETYDNNPNTRDEAQRENADQQENQKEKHLESSSKKKRMDSGSVLDDKMMKLVDHQLNTIGSDDHRR
ncbi:hypothetical protein JYU34_022502 [Plutella xylostella]|uniref:MADF domain-containing protein n=1 Tax=Plutella xylostella TaxID=51655 RepID=A0ABQ7PPX3_PLUXY|nr:hypothetical protein JYU34_022502 [Plutella xylostella]